MALRVVFEAARLGLRMRGMTPAKVSLPEGAPVPEMAFLDGRRAPKPDGDAPDAPGAAGDGGGRSSRPLCVFVHGLGSSVVTWSPVLPAAVREAPVVAPDLPGYGKTPLPHDLPFPTFKDQVAAMHAFLDALSPDAPVQLIGQSMGGWIAGRVAAERPDRVCRLTLVNSAGILHPQVFEQRRLFSPNNKTELRELWGRMWHRLPPSYYLFERQYLEVTRKPVVRGFLETLERDDFLNLDLGRIGAPTLLVWGLSDHLISYESVRQFRAGIPDIRYRPMPDCGHVAQRERTPLFLSYLLPWLRGDEPPEPSTEGLQQAQEAAILEAAQARKRALGDPEVQERMHEAVEAGIWDEDEWGQIHP